MNATRNRAIEKTSFVREAAFGFVISVFGSVLLTGLQWLIDPDTALRIVIVVVGIAATTRLLSIRRTGRVVLGGIWIAAAVVCWLLPLTLPALSAAHAGLLWALKSLHTRARTLETLINAGVTLLALAGAAWAATETGSPFLAFWCFFLAFSLAAVIRKPALVLSGSKETAPQTLDKFDAAYRAARAALSELTSTRRSHR